MRDEAKIELAKIVIRKVGLFRTIRHVYRESQEPNLLQSLDEIIKAVERATSESL